MSSHRALGPRRMNPVRTVLGLAIVVVGGVIGAGCDNDKGLVPTVLSFSPQQVQIDRMGQPLVEVAFILSGLMSSFKLGDPTTDSQAYRPTSLQSVQQLRTQVNGVVGFPSEDSPGVTPDTAVDTVLPDVITIDFSRPIAFPNGRNLQDDVADYQLGLLLNRGQVLNGGAGFPDGVSNDSIFLATFPYVGTPH